MLFYTHEIFLEGFFFGSPRRGGRSSVDPSAPDDRGIKSDFDFLLTSMIRVSFHLALVSVPIGALSGGQQTHFRVADDTRVGAVEVESDGAVLSSATDEDESFTADQDRVERSSDLHTGVFDSHDEDDHDPTKTKSLRDSPLIKSARAAATSSPHHRTSTKRHDHQHVSFARAGPLAAAEVGTKFVPGLVDGIVGPKGSIADMAPGIETPAPVFAPPGSCFVEAWAGKFGDAAHKRGVSTGTGTWVRWIWS